MGTCNYTYEEIGIRGNKWISGCKKEILYVSPQGQGVASPPLPTDNGARYCTFCGKTIKLKTVTPRKEFTPPRALPEIPQEVRPEKPAYIRPGKPITKDADHNTYDGWLELGHQVQVGQKSIGRGPENEALFHRNQTKRSTKVRPYFAKPHFSNDYDDDIPF